MPTVLTSSQQTFVDITDQRKLSAYITSNLPKTQSEDPNVLPHTYAPSWASTHLVLTPVVFLDQTSIALGSSGLTITWKRKDGTSAETAVTSGEAVSGGILTVSQNKLSASSSGMITYICYISYYDSETKNTVNISSDITFTLVRNAENAKLAYVNADTYVFKYDTSGALVGATQATLTGQVQGVTISKWQYKNSSGGWADYPTTSDNTSITGGTLVVKPAHAVFANNVAQIKLVTSDADVYDTVTITKIYDGTKGDPGTPGSSGSGGLSVILSNEAQSIPCTSGGAVTAATNVTIPFTAYEGIEQKAATCTVGTLPSGVTVKSNTPATATAAGSVVLTFAKNSTLGGASVLTGTIPLTFSVSGKSVVKNFAWTKANAGTSGTSAVVFSVYAPNGTIVQNQSGSLTLATSAYEGATAITNATYQWAKYSGGTWVNISGATAATLTVQGADIVNIQSYRCTMTYNSKNYVDVITVEDKSDPYVSEMLSIGGFTVKNNLGGLVPYVIVRTNQREVDPLKGNISETAPANPAAGDFWYQIDHTGHTVTLMKYSGSAWSAATETQELTYTWYAQDKDGNPITFDKTGKVIYLSAADIDSILPDAGEEGHDPVPYSLEEGFDSRPHGFPCGAKPTENDLCQRLQQIQRSIEKAGDGMPPSLYQSIDRCGTLGGEIESVPDTRKCGSLICGNCNFRPEKKPLTALRAERILSRAASMGVTIAVLIPFHTDVAVFLIPLNRFVAVFFTDSNAEETLLLMPSTTVEMAVLIPFQIVVAVVLMALKTVVTKVFTALICAVTVETIVLPCSAMSPTKEVTSCSFPSARTHSRVWSSWRRWILCGWKCGNATRRLPKPLSRSSQRSARII